MRSILAARFLFIASLPALAADLFTARVVRGPDPQNIVVMVCLMLRGKPTPRAQDRNPITAELNKGVFQFSVIAAPYLNSIEMYNLISKSKTGKAK
jgi:hypothetical protein